MMNVTAARVLEPELKSGPIRVRKEIQSVNCPRPLGRLVHDETP
jgi:hypothetical protein